jgi:hypothetical protein
MPESALSRLARSTELSKIRIAFRLSDAPSVLDGLTQVRIRLSSKPFNHIVRAKPCQPTHPTAFTHVFHMCNLVGSGLLGSFKSSLQRATAWPSALDIQKHRFPGARRSGRQKIEKRTCFGGPCFEGTLQKPTGVSESSPVAGTIENSAFSEILDAGRTREIQTNYDRLPHICSR